MAWFAFDIDEYDADTMHLSAAQDGAYMRLLRFYYKTRLPLPDNDHALANIARVSMDEWEAMKLIVRAFFKSRRGRLHSKRADKELDREDSLSTKRSEKARNAANKRHKKTKTSLLRASAEHDSVHARDMLNGATRPDQTIEEDKESSSIPVDAQFEQWYATYPRREGKGHALKAYRTARKKGIEAEELSRGRDRYIAQCVGKDPQYVRLPATWLNGQGWLDEAPAPPSSRPKGGLYGGAMA